MAKTRIEFAVLLLLFGLFLLIDQIVGNVRQRVDLQRHHSRMKRDVVTYNSEHIQKRSLRQSVSRTRRDAEDSMCKEQETLLQNKRKNEPEFLSTNKFTNETKYSIAIAWMGENTGVYLVADSMMNTDLWITRDSGDSFTLVKLPFVLTSEIIFYPDKKQVDVLLVQERNMIYISRDGGFTWKVIKENVQHMKWGSDATGTESILYLTCATNKTNSNRLLQSTDFGETWTTIKESVYSFGSKGKFLYASVIDENVPSERLMEVSTDAGATWNEVQLPSITADRFYSILDMSEGMLFIHVDSPNDSGQGTLYTSDSSGVIFSESLQHHLYPNFVDLTDFYKVRSMRGVYLASQIEDDRSIHTVITFDRGASWQPVKRPSGVMCMDETKPCFLQIHNQYSRSRGIEIQTPLSIENAVGIIIVHGHVAEALQKTPPDVFVSSDGGYSWTKALDGPHSVQIADHGGLLVAIPSVPNPTVIKFSNDEGRCWHSFNFTTEQLVVTGLLTEPGNRAMSVGIWGFGQNDHMWRVHVLNFSKIITKQCNSMTDYKNWMAHGDNTDDTRFRGCLLGMKETLRRLKKDALCANGYSYEVTKTQEVCICRIDDYDCDYGYRRTTDPTGQQVCMEDPMFKNKKLDICRLGYEEEIITKGYRKVPGDKCQGGFEPAGEKLKDLKVRCSINSKELIMKEIEMGKKANAHRASSVIWVAIVMTLFLLAVVTVSYFVRRYNLLRGGSGSFAYSSLSQNEDGLEEALLNSALYDETSEELATATDTVSIPNNYSTMNGASSSPSRASANTNTNTNTQSSTPNKYSVQPHLKSFHDDSDVDMLD